MRRICCFCETWASGGIESFLCNVLQNLDLSETSVDVVAACMKESIFTSDLRTRGIRFVELSGKPRGFQNFREFSSLLQKNKYDVVHINMFHAVSLYYLHMAKRAGVPVRLAHSHNSALAHKRLYRFKLLIHAIFRKLFTRDATQLVAPSKSAANFMFDRRVRCRKGYEIISNGISCERFRFDRKKWEMVREQLGFKDCFVVGNVGRLCTQKNQKFLLRAFAEVLEKCREAKLLLVGDGEDRVELQCEAKRLGISEHVVFYGNCSDVEQLFWAMDVFAFPSLFEGLGIGYLI